MAMFRPTLVLTVVVLIVGSPDRVAAQAANDRPVVLDSTFAHQILNRLDSLHIAPLRLVPWPKAVGPRSLRVVPAPRSALTDGIVASRRQLAGALAIPTVADTAFNRCPGMALPGMDMSACPSEVFIRVSLAIPRQGGWIHPLRRGVGVQEEGADASDRWTVRGVASALGPSGGGTELFDAVFVARGDTWVLEEVHSLAIFD
jgi:hypothetical protein